MEQKRKWDVDFPHNGDKIDSLHSCNLSTLSVETQTHTKRNEKTTQKYFKEIKQ
jgi:hypothetical protein